MQKTTKYVLSESDVKAALTIYIKSYNEGLEVDLRNVKLSAINGDHEESMLITGLGVTYVEQT